MIIRNVIHKRSLLLGAIILVAAFIVTSDALFEKIEEIIQLVESLIFQYPVFGVLLFIMLAMASAMLAFYSSAILVPIGVYTWGATECFILLWIGWLLGGILSFSIGRHFGRSVASIFIGDTRISKFERKVNRHAKFIHILLFQAALPSEIPGYVLGALRYRFSLYCLALAITELPYALGTVYIGESFLQRNSLVVLVLGVFAIAAITCLHFLYRQHFHISGFFKDHNHPH